MRKNYFLTALMLLISLNSFSQITLQPFASGFSSPIDLKHAGDDRIFVVEQGGYIKIIDTLGNHYPGNFLDIHSIMASGGEQGLLGLAFHPGFANNGYFYVNYTDLDGDTKISRFEVSSTNPDSAVAASEEVLLTIQQPFSNHNGGHIAFGPDGYLYIGMGDGGSGGDPDNRAQNLDSLLGKMLRIDVDTPTGYIIPTTNPYVGVANSRDEIWAPGLRNPWRWSFDRLTGDLWIGDVGQNAYEEIDFQPAGSSGGENYGWRCYEGNHTYNTSSGCSGSYTSPALEVPQSSGACAIIGGYVYRGAEYANLYGKYFFSDECLQNIKYLLPNGSGGFNLTDLGSLASGTTNVSMGEDKWGEVYVLDYGGDIYKLEGQGCAPIAEISVSDTLLICGDTATISTPLGRGFHYQWSLDANSIGIDSSSININQSGNYQVIATNRNGCKDTSAVVFINFTDTIVTTIAGLDTFYCTNHSPILLTGVPAGGSFSGNGIIGNNFDPATAGVGTHSIKYTYSNINGCSDSTSSEVTVSLCTGIEENNEATISIYPNPNQGEFMIQFFMPSKMLMNIEVVNILGRSVYETSMVLTPGYSEQKMNLKRFPKGVYWIKLTNNEEIMNVQKVILD